MHSVRIECRSKGISKWIVRLDAVQWSTDVARSRCLCRKNRLAHCSRASAYASSTSPDNIQLWPVVFYKCQQNKYETWAWTPTKNWSFRRRPINRRKCSVCQTNAKWAYSHRATLHYGPPHLTRHERRLYTWARNAAPRICTTSEIHRHTSKNSLQSVTAVQSLASPQCPQQITYRLAVSSCANCRACGSTSIRQRSKSWPPN